jgi:RodZ C-terminal domain
VALAGIVAVTVLVIAAWQLGGSDGDGAEQAATGTVVTGTTGATIAEEPVGEAPSVQLVLTARKASAAIEVRRDSATGELLWEGTLSKGDDQSVEGDRLWVRIGKGQNIALTLNGEPVERLGRGEQVLLVTETGVQPASP